MNILEAQKLVQSYHHDFDKAAADGCEEEFAFAETVNQKAVATRGSQELEKVSAYLTTQADKFLRDAVRVREEIKSNELPSAMRIAENSLFLAVQNGFHSSITTRVLIEVAAALIINQEKNS